MINVYIKTGTTKGQSAIAIILESQKHKWTKSFKIDRNLPSDAFSRYIVLESIGALYALKHIKNKYKKKKVVLHTSSDHIISSLKKVNDKKYANKTKIDSINDLRDVVGGFNNIKLKKFNKSTKEQEDELEHLFLECAIDNIQIDEKE